MNHSRSPKRVTSWARLGEDADESAVESNQIRNEVEQAGVNYVLDYERRHGRDPRDMNEAEHNHAGYDIQSCSGNEAGPGARPTLSRVIEVKSLKSAWG